MLLDQSAIHHVPFSIRVFSDPHQFALFYSLQNGLAQAKGRKSDGALRGLAKSLTYGHKRTTFITES
jgi:hypothetical protein